MDGFKNEENNVLFDNGSLKIIMMHLVLCSRKMKDDCIKNSEMIDNSENKITNRLTAKYLNNQVVFHFEPQTQEKYNQKTDTYEGIPDIKVFSKDLFFNSQAYFLIESKRIDGSTDLNREYVENGVSRFVIAPPKYTSHYKQNIMFAYIVQTIDIPKNVEKIKKYQQELLIGVVASDFSIIQTDIDYTEYSCNYSSIEIGKIELRHLFFDFTDVVSKL